MYKIEIATNNGIIEGENFAFLSLKYKTWDDSKEKIFLCTNNVNKKGICTCQVDGFKIKIDVLNNKILNITDVSTIRNGTAKIMQGRN